MVAMTFGVGEGIDQPETNEIIALFTYSSEYVLQLLIIISHHC